MAGQSKRGFAAMNPQTQREIASKGGQAAHQKGTAHEFSPDEARAAGRLGGKAVSSNRAHMATIGRKGGQRSAVGGRPSVIEIGHHTNGNSHNYESSNTGEHNMAENASAKATDMLRADHTKVSGLFHQYEANDDQVNRKESIVRQICSELDVHAKLEEELFYPAVEAKSDEGGRRKVQEGIEEHRRIKKLIVQLLGKRAHDDEYDDTVHELKQCVAHHVDEEETGVLPDAEKNLGNQLQQLGAQMQRRKQQLLATMQPTMAPGMPEHHTQSAE
jgi:general stress protein YciG/hemerythrin-like domain-containing protein